MIILDFIVCIVALILAFRIKTLFHSFNSDELKLLDYILLYHVFMSVVFHFYIKLNGGDAYHYWQAPKQYDFNEIWTWVVTIGRPTQIMFLFNFFFTNTLNLSFLTGNIIYGILGYSAIVLFLATIKEIMPYYQLLKSIKVVGISVFPLILFLPNLHFWSAGVGKDTILFFCISLFAYSIFKSKINWFGIFISLVLSYLVRPHITLFLIAGFGIGFMLDGKLKGYVKSILMVIFTFGFIILFDSVLSFVNIEEFNAESFTQFADSKASALSARGGSIVDISAYPYPLKVFTFLFRPLFFDMNNIIALVASFENLLLLILFIKFFVNKGINSLIKSNYIVKGAFIFFLLGTLSFSLILGNLGIMLRQKNMFMLMIYIFLLWGYYHSTITPSIIRLKYANKILNHRRLLSNREK